MDKSADPPDLHLAQDTPEEHWKRFQDATRKILTTPKPEKQPVQQESKPK